MPDPLRPEPGQPLSDSFHQLAGGIAQPDIRQQLDDMRQRLEAATARADAEKTRADHLEAMLPNAHLRADAFARKCMQLHLALAALLAAIGDRAALAEATRAALRALATSANAGDARAVLREGVEGVAAAAQYLANEFTALSDVMAVVENDATPARVACQEEAA